MFKLFSVVGFWNIPLIKTKELPVEIPVVFAPPTFILNVAAIPVNEVERSSKMTLLVYVFLKYVLPWKSDLGKSNNEEFFERLFVPFGASVKCTSEPIILKEPENTLPVTLLLWLDDNVPKEALSTPIILNVPIPVTGPDEVVPNPTDVTFTNSSPNLMWSSKLISAVASTHISVVVVEILPPELFTSVVVTGENAIGDWMIPSITNTVFSSRLAIVKRCEFPAPTFVNVLALPPLEVASWKVLFVNFLTNTVVGKLTAPVICRVVAPTPANVDLGV